MRRCASRVSLLAVLVLAALGCAKKDGSGGGGNGEGGDPNATYTITFRGPEKGDKTEVVRTRTGTATVKIANSTQTRNEQFRYEFTETILDVSPDEPRPTKVTRIYKTAQKTDAKGEMRDRSFIGKTITIEKYLKGYKYDADGKSLPVTEQTEINEEFTRAQWKLDQNLPKKPVKVGEEWAVDFAAITALGGKPQADYDKDKSKITGKLVKAYKKDGRQWGVIEVRITLVIDTAEGGMPVKGQTDSDVTFDIVIDGSARAGTMKMTTKGSFEGRGVKTTVEGSQEESLTPVK